MEQNEFFCIDEDQETLQDFYDDFTNRYTEIEHLVAQIELEPQNETLFSTLYKALDVVRVSAGVSNLPPVAESLETVENILQRLMTKQVSYSSHFSEALILIMDQLLIVAREAAHSRQIPFQLFNTIQSGMRPMVLADQTTFTQAIDQTIAILTGEFISESDMHSGVDLFEDDADLFSVDPPSLDHPDNGTAPSYHHTIDISQILQLYRDRQDRDLALFRILAGSMAERHDFWGERTDYVMRFALGMNALAGNPVDWMQLEAAVYMHDFAMARLPDDVLGKKQDLAPSEWAKVVSHPMWGRDLLNILGGWEEAARIVLQHHERVDGTGYPHGLKEAPKFSLSVMPFTP
jgi:hypothetical protein